MKLTSTLVLLCALAPICGAQEITVHVVDDKTEQPINGVSVVLWKGCETPHKPKAISQKTSVTGTTVFQSISLTNEPICINLSTISYAPQTLDYIFVAPEQTKKIDKFLNRIVTSLPAEITFRVRKRSFQEQLEVLFLGP